MKSKKVDHDNLNFWGHLEVLRWHLIKSLLAVVACFLASLFFAGDIFDILKEPLIALEKENLIKLYSDKLQGPFIIYLKIALISGIVFSFPIIMYQLVKFILPALYVNEKRLLFIGLPFSVILFLTGTYIAYSYIAPFAIRFFVIFNDKYLGIKMIIMVHHYFDMLFAMVILTGLVFQLPIIISILAKLGIVTPKKLRKWRPVAIILIMCLAAFITPPDPFSMIAFSIPLYLLYELSVIVSKYIVKNNEKNKLNDIS